MSSRPPVTLTIHNPNELKFKVRFPEAAYSLDISLSRIIERVITEYNTYAPKRSKVELDIVRAFGLIAHEKHLSLPPEEYKEQITKPLKKFAKQFGCYWT